VGQNFHLFGATTNASHLIEGANRVILIALLLRTQDAPEKKYSRNPSRQCRLGANFRAAAPVTTRNVNIVASLVAIDIVGELAGVLISNWNQIVAFLKQMAMLQAATP
jgi:hypothetical protein